MKKSQPLQKVKFLSCFSLYDFAYIENLLNKMSRENYVPEHFGSFLWTFRKTDDGNRAFRVLYRGDRFNENLLSSDGFLPFTVDPASSITGRGLKIFYKETGTAVCAELNESERFDRCLENLEKSILSQKSAFILLLCLAMVSVFKGFSAFTTVLTVYAMLWVLLNLSGFFWWKSQAKKSITAETRIKAFPAMNIFQSVSLLGFCMIILAYILYVIMK